MVYDKCSLGLLSQVAVAPMHHYLAYGGERKMKTSYDLVKALSESFDDSLSKPTDNRITAPLLVIYSGKNAAQHDAVIMNSFRQVWLTARAERICRAIRENGALLPISGDNSAGEAKDIYTCVDAMYRCGNIVFCDFTKLTVVVLYDVRDHASPEDMIRAYETDVAQYSQEFDRYNTTVVRMLVIDSTRERAAFTKSIRSYLADQNEKGNAKGTFLFSTTLYGGRQMSYEQVYDLIGKVIAMGCTDFEESLHLDVFGSYGDGTIRTVSCTKMERPNKEICSIMIRQYLDWWERYFLRGTTPNEKELKERLGIIDKGYALTDMVYDHIKNKFPPLEALTYLPMHHVGKDVGNMANMLFSTFDELTMHSFALFYEKQVLPVLQEGSVNEYMRKVAREWVQSHISMPEILRINDEMMDKIAMWCQSAIRPVSPGQIVANSIENENKVQIEKALARILPTELRNYRELAMKQVRVLFDVRQDFTQNVIVDPTNNIAEYYEPKVEAYLNEHSASFVREVVESGTEKQSVFAQMHTFAEKMIGSREAFRLAFEEELQERTNDKNGIYQNIRNEILSHTTQNIYYNANTMPDALFRVILMNQKKADGGNTELYEEMRTHLFHTGEDHFVDNGNSNGVVALQVYSLSSVAIL